MLAVKLGDLSLESPILNASGAFNPSVFSQLYPLSGHLGGIVTKTVTFEPRPGNLQPRTVELPGVGMLNSIGLQNPGLDHFLDVESQQFAEHGVPIILSISAYSKAGFAQMLEKIIAHAAADHVAAIEINLSCPNVDKGGVEFSSSAALVTEAVSAVCGQFKKPVFAKLTPNVASMLPMAEAALNAGATGITAINTVFGAAIDIRKRKPILPRISGGYSGPGIKPIALHHVLQLRKAFPDTPIIGVGGISNANDILEFVMAGASAVQVGTACFRDPMIFKSVVTDLKTYCQHEGIESLASLIGCAHA